MIEVPQQIEKLMEKYIKQIEIEEAGLEPVDAAFGKPDGASLNLIVPIIMLKEYLKLKGQRKNLPDPEEFRKDTNLIDRLYQHCPIDKVYQSPVEDVLSILGIRGELECEYHDLFTRPGYIRVSISEIKSQY